MLLAVIPAAALIGASIAAGSWSFVKEGIERLLIDVLIIWVTGALIIAWKRASAHKRQPMG